MKKTIKVFVDTNIFISSILFPGSLPDLAINKARLKPYQLYTSEYCIRELFDVFHKKFAHRIGDLHKYLDKEIPDVTIVNTFVDYAEEEKLIRDQKDIRVLRGAISCEADILLTGDKDFLDSDITNPKIHNPKSFLEL